MSDALVLLLWWAAIITGLLGITMMLAVYITTAHELARTGKTRRAQLGLPGHHN